MIPSRSSPSTSSRSIPRTRVKTALLCAPRDGAVLFKSGARPSIAKGDLGTTCESVSRCLVHRQNPAANRCGSSSRACAGTTGPAAMPARCSLSTAARSLAKATAGMSPCLARPSGAQFLANAQLFQFSLLAHTMPPVVRPCRPVVSCANPDAVLRPSRPTLEAAAPRPALNVPCRIRLPVRLRRIPRSCRARGYRSAR